MVANHFYYPAMKHFSFDRIGKWHGTHRFHMHAATRLAHTMLPNGLVCKIELLLWVFLLIDMFSL